MRGAVDAPRPLRHAIAGAAQALAFLTVLPVRGANSAAGLKTDSAAAWFPLVGALVGGLAGGVRVGGEQLVGVLPASVLAVASLVAVTGALHEDGLADVADALGARGGRERRLAVMRDPANGTFGTLALVCWTLVMVTAIASLSASRALRTLVLACALGRTAALAHASLQAPARSDGLGAAFAPGRAAVTVAGAATAAAAVPLSGLSNASLAVVATALTTVVVTVASRRFFGGRTGDTLGATVAVTEAVVCLTLLAGWR